MPKKTKKQKILAEYRRKLNRLKSVSSDRLAVKITSSLKSNPTSSFEEKTSSFLKYDQSLVQFTISDLKRTIFITFFILSLEFLVFYVNLLK